MRNWSRAVSTDYSRSSSTTGTRWQRLHEPVGKPEGEEPSRVRRRKGEVPRLRYTPTGNGSDLLINRMAEGGPLSLSALLTYLAGSQAVAGRGES